MPVIDSQTARELAAKSHEARRRNKELREQAEQEPQPTPQIAPDELPPEASRVRAKLIKLDELMDGAEDDRQWDCYSRAYERMFRVWCTLTKTPGPGNLRPATKPARQALALPSPAQLKPSDCAPYTPSNGSSEPKQ